MPLALHSASAAFVLELLLWVGCPFICGGVSRVCGLRWLRGSLDALFSADKPVTDAIRLFKTIANTSFLSALRILIKYANILNLLL